MEQYLIYLRKSRSDLEAEAHGEGETLSRHEHTLLELAKRQHLNVTDIYREVVSGDTIAARPMMQRVLSEVEQGVWSGVLVMEVERLARGDTIDQGIIAQTFKFSGTKIITPIKTYDPDNEFDEEYFEFGLFMSRREYKIINRRLQRGRLASAKEGKWPSGLAPFGYRRVKLKNEKGCSLEPIEEQAAIVRMIFDLYTVGLQDEDGSARPLSLGSIATRLNDMHIPSPSGSQWARITIRGIIKNPTYIGMVRWGSRETKKKVVDGKVVSVRGPADPEKECIFKGIHPPLIPKETFELANDKLARSENTSTHKEKVVRNPLAGLLVCSECGRQMMRMINPVHPDMPVVRCPRRGCPNCSSYLPIVEERVIQGLSEWMKGYELEWSSATASSSVSSVGVREKALASAEAELRKLQQQLERTHDFLEQGIYDTDTFLSRSRMLSNKIAAAKDSVARCSRELTEEKLRETSRRDIIPKVKNLLDVYPLLETAEEKNALLKEVLEKVVYQKLNEKRKKSPDGFTIEIYPRIPKSEK